VDRRLNIAFVWHMHQPLYRDPFTGAYDMPWVLLHATKDYIDMVSILERFPEIHQTFNLVPSLMEQLQDYSSPDVKDIFRDISARRAEELTPDDKVFLLSNFFSASREQMISPLPGYARLLRKLGLNFTDDPTAALRFFSNKEFLDLQVYFNLVWIDPSIRGADPFLRGLYEKGGGYTEEEKRRLLDKQIELAGEVLPLYRDFMEKGLIEVSTTPYYHPIMPILYDSLSAREAMPEIALPETHIKYPEDVRAQLRKAVDLYGRVFGRPPRGLWPSEGSVSTEIIPLVQEAGFRWAATDEEILTHSLGRPFRRDEYGHPLDNFLYKPWTVGGGEQELSIVFRDHVLSDLIGFDYSKVDPEAAAQDFLNRLGKIYERTSNPEASLVSIILDGENAWECYKNDGADFLEALYGRLTSDDRFRCVTVSEYLEGGPEHGEVKRLFAGSWINHNFRVWIGHEEDNRAWDLLARVRARLIEAQESLGREEGGQERIKEAWEEVYAAEGSDWFWWFGDDHSSANDARFDALFRKHIKRIYTLIGEEPPANLEVPIMTTGRVVAPSTQPRAYINPVLDGEVTNYYEWLSSGLISNTFFGSSMHREAFREVLLDGIVYGFSREELFFRLDYSSGARPYERPWTITLNFTAPLEVKIKASIHGSTCEAVVYRRDNEAKGWEETEADVRIASGKVVEMAIPFSLLGASGGDSILFFINIDSEDFGPERWPARGLLTIEAPGDEFEEERWLV